jgi:hypothetical protein
MPASRSAEIEQAEDNVERSLRIAAACVINAEGSGSFHESSVYQALHDDSVPPGEPLYTYESLKEIDPPLGWLTEVVKAVGQLQNEGN